MRTAEQQIKKADSKSWAEIRSLFNDVRNALGDDDTLTSELEAELLRRRAVEFARETERRDAEETSREDYLLFSLGKDTYAIPCEHIEEVIPLQNLVALPRTNRYIMGISSNRGVLIAIIDLKRILNIPASELTTMHRVIVARHETYHVGFLVDVVHGMRSIDMKLIKNLPQELNERTQRFLRGVAEDDMHILNPIEVVKEIGSSSEQSMNTQPREQHGQVQS
ncbi:MAG: hypothetical protein C0600_06585 [Ignavibacteria bacterium]|nr:MAG: hypothetical protein C0600_06585 [Ignavibacteria bacterium]